MSLLTHFVVGDQRKPNLQHALAEADRVFLQVCERSPHTGQVLPDEVVSLHPLQDDPRKLVVRRRVAAKPDNCKHRDKL